MWDPTGERSEQTERNEANERHKFIKQLGIWGEMRAL